MNIDHAARKFGSPESIRTGIHLVYSRSWTYEERSHAIQGAPHVPAKAEVPGNPLYTLWLMSTLALTVPAIWAFHSILHSLHVL